jgi:hypothetical protein
MDTIRSTTITNSALVENPSIITSTARLSSEPVGDFSIPLSESMLRCIADAVDTSYASHNKTNGSTVSLVHGNMVGMKLFSVSIYPSRAITLWERPTWGTLFDFAKANLDLLLMPFHGLGTWFNDYDLVHCLNIVVLVGGRVAAVDLGLRSNQVAIFDLEARREIPVPHPFQESVAKFAEVAND